MCTDKSMSRTVNSNGRSPRSGLRWVLLAIPLVLVPGRAIGQCEVELSSPAAVGGFGGATSLQGDDAFVSAQHSDSQGLRTGSIHIFRRSINWAEVQTLIASDGMDNDTFGASISLDADTLAVGAPGVDGPGTANAGAVYLLDRNTGGPDNWGELAKVGATADYFGVAVSLSGDTLVASAIHDTGLLGDPGYVYVFERDAGGLNAWGQVKELIPSDLVGFEEFGVSVSISGDTIVVGAMFATNGSGLLAGAAYVFERDQGGPGNWGEVQKIVASDGIAGAIFARAVWVVDDLLVIGAPYDDARGTKSGAAYVFERSAGLWTESAKLVGSTTDAQDRFGLPAISVGDTILLGGWNHESGRAYVFERDEGGPDNWGETEELKSSNGVLGDAFGGSLASLGGTHLVGAPGRAVPVSGAGATYVYSQENCPPGLAYCFGDGSQTQCPCGNSQPGSGEGCPNSTGSGAILAAAGSTSYAANDLVLDLVQMPGGITGMVIAGSTSMSSNLFFGGLLCVGGNNERGPIFISTGNGRASVTDLVNQMGADGGGTLIQPGNTVYFQIWYRDPLSSPCDKRANFSNGLEVLYTP